MASADAPEPEARVYFETGSRNRVRRLVLDKLALTTGGSDAREARRVEVRLR